MAYEKRPGQGSMFLNTRKTKDTQPDWKGDVLTLDGQLIELAGWNKESKGYKFISISAKASGSYTPAQPSIAPSGENLPF